MNSTVSLFEGLSTSVRARREIVHHSNEPHNIHHNFYDANIYLALPDGCLQMEFYFQHKNELFSSQLHSSRSAALNCSRERNSVDGAESQGVARRMERKYCFMAAVNKWNDAARLFL